MPVHLQLCLRTVEKNAGVPVILVTPHNITEYVPDPHPAYPFLHLAHRADYLRACLLHKYGGIYLDVDTICLQSLAGLFDLLDTYEAVGYDGSQWGEIIGISCMGPFRPASAITELWFNALHGKLQQRIDDIHAHREDVFYWQEILRDIFVPVSMIHKDKIAKGMLIHNPDQDVLWSTRLLAEAVGGELQRSHVFILNNAKYGKELQSLSEDQILSGPAVLSQLLRHALA